MPSTYFYKSVGTPTTFIKADRVGSPPTNVGPASAWDAHSGAVTEVTSVEYFTDISANEFSVVPTSGAVISTDNPYSDSSLSVDCNTTAPAHGHLVIGPSTNLDYDNNTSFTVEFWMKADPASGTTENIVGYGTSLNDAGINWMIRRNSSGIRFMLKNGPLYYADATTGINEGQWNHVAAVGTGSEIKLWINGVYRTSTAVSNMLQNTGGSLYIGRYINQFNGKIADFRYVVGTEVYTGTSNFTPPTAPLSNITNTQVLLRPQSETFNASRALISLNHNNAYNYDQSGSFLGKGIFYVGRMRTPVDGGDASLWTGLLNNGLIYAVENRDAGQDDFGIYQHEIGRVTNPDVSVPRPTLNQEFTTGMYINSSGQIEYSVNGQVFHTTSTTTAVAGNMLPFIRMYGTTTAEYELERVAIMTAGSHDEAYSISGGETKYVSKIIRPIPAGAPTPPFSSSSDAIAGGYGGSIAPFYIGGVTTNAYIDTDGWILYSSFASENTLTSTNATAWNGNNVLNADLAGLGYTTNAGAWNDGTGASTNTAYNRPAEHYYFYTNGNGYVDISTWNGPSNANQIKVIWQGVAPYEASSRVIVNGGSELSTQPTEEAFSPTGSTPLLRMVENSIGIFAVNSIWFKM